MTGRSQGQGLRCSTRSQWGLPPEGGFSRCRRARLDLAPARYRAEDSNTAFLTSEAITYIWVRREQPWFVHISSLAPHPPFVAPDAYHALYDPSNVPPPAQAASPEIEAEQHPWRAYHLYNQKGIGCTVGVTAADNLSLSEGDLRQLRATYYGMMSEVDAQVGRLIDHIESTGEYERTLIVFGSDHGEQLGDHWMFAKYGDFDQSFLNPLILRDP